MHQHANLLYENIMRDREFPIQFLLSIILPKHSSLEHLTVSVSIPNLSAVGQSLTRFSDEQNRWRIFSHEDEQGLNSDHLLQTPDEESK